MTGKRGGRRWWPVNGGVRAAAGKGHPIPEIHLRKDKFYSGSKQMPEKGLFLILATIAQEFSQGINTVELEKSPPETDVESSSADGSLCFHIPVVSRSTEQISVINRGKNYWVCLSLRIWMKCIQGQARKTEQNHVFNGSVKMRENRWLACTTEKKY